MILECTPDGPLPPNSTVTWTINPDGTGFTTETGRVLPTSSGTFIVTGDGGNINVQPFPPDGAFYDPALDGPVTFSFSEAMDQTVDPSSAVIFARGTWARAEVTQSARLNVPRLSRCRFPSPRLSLYAAPTFMRGTTRTRFR